MEYRGFRDLKVYQLSYKLALEIFEATKTPLRRIVFFNRSNQKIIQVCSFKYWRSMEKKKISESICK